MLNLVVAALTLGLSFASDAPSLAPSVLPTAPLSTAPSTPPSPPPTPPPSPPSVFKGDAYGHLSLNSFAPYPMLAGVNVSGYVLLSHANDTVTIDYKLMGVDETCTTRDPATPNSCGMHIHVGFSCETDVKVGIHYWDQGTPSNKVPDPWVYGPSYYQFDSSTKMAKGEVSVKFGFGVDAAKGHAFVIHDRKGARISCGLLPATTDKVTLGQFSPYPMYEGPLKAVKGCVNMDFRGVSVAVGYNLTGVDPMCTTPNPDIPNSCGLHIHTGMTCTNGTDIGGHYFDVGQQYFPSTPMPASGDPWAAASISVSAATGWASGTLQVDYGFGFETSRGRAVVLHDYNGTRVACAQLPMYADRVTTPLPALDRFPGYEGPPITGSVKLDFRGNAVKLVYKLQGTEPTCASGVPGEAANSCGIHIHHGLTCAEAGGHYYDNTKLSMDPWAVATYRSQAAENSLIVGYGYSFDMTKGRTVVVHSYNGTKVACATIPAVSSFAAMVTNFMPMPEATEPITANSTVLFDFRPLSVRMSYNLMGVEPACAMHNAETPNSCGLHIHQGYNCSAPGGHFFATETDPWTSDYYVATPQGTAKGYIDVEYGYGFADARGRAVVLHNYAGMPVACSTLPTVSILTDHAGISKLVPLPGASVPVTGNVLLSVSGLGVKIDYDLNEVEPMCSSVGPNPLSCGIHIHKGFSCDMPLTHFYNNVTYPADPWMYASYVSSGAMAYGSVVVSYGEGWTATEGRTVVVHNYAGEKVSCAVIPQTTDQVTATGFKYLANATAAPGDVLLDFRSDSVMMTYHLSNVDAGCDAPAPGVANSCGLHIHTGTSCADLTTVGGHYFDATQFPTDPWAEVVYKADAEGHAMGVVNVEYGYGYAMTKGRVVVVHDKAGIKVSCAVIPMQTAENEELSVYVSTMGKYPEYTGPYAVGVTTLSLGFKGVGTKIMYSLTGVPCECTQMGTAANSCGLHIHMGVSCSDPTMVGGHWFNKTMIPDDPWATATYTSASCADTCLDNSAGTTASGAITIDYGYGPAQTLDKVLVVHDYQGNRIACTPISDMHPLPRDLDMTGVLSVSALNKYPESMSAYGANVTGEVQLHFVGPEVTLSWNVHNVDPNCGNGPAPNVPNSCGLHIHKGWSCDNSGAVGGHYYPENMTMDPWRESYYTSNPFGDAKGSLSVLFGYTIDETKGRTFVFHDFKGFPMTCSVLGSTTDRVTLGTIMPLPMYAGAVKDTAGCVTLEFRGTSVQINFNLTNVDKECAMGPQENVANSCGIHIHTGTSCDNATTAGEHLYDHAVYALDLEPWKYVTYKPDQEGRAMAMVNVEYGYGFDMSQGHAFVIHDYNGMKMSCNLIPVSPERDMAPLPPLGLYPGYEGEPIEGSVKLDFRGHGVKITYNLTGTNPECMVPGPAPNSCGIHIHSGFTCATAGPHYFNSALYPMDPWSAAVYAGSPMGSLIVSYGFDYDQSKGRTVVVHDWNGNRAACAVIPATTDRATASNFVKLGTTFVQPVGGMVTLDFRPTSVHITYNLTQIDGGCSAPIPGVVNSCGLHIHEGMSCGDDGASALGHYFDHNMYTVDPWQNITYKEVEGKANGVVDVEFGYGFMQTRGRTFVVHDAQGKKMACAVISTGNALRDTVGVVSFMPLEPTAIQGKVLVDFQGMGVKLSYDLMGVEANCSSVGPAKLSCGIHIHQGFSCSDPMGHYYNMNSYPTDPWMYASYTTLGGMARGSLVVSYGEDFSASMGRSLVLHNYAGAKVACQTIPQITDNVLVENFKPITGTPMNESKVGGKVAMAFRPTSVRMDLNLTETDPRCVMKNEKPLSCGIHIHSGSCLTPEGHFWNTNLFPADPWMNVTYVSNAQGASMSVLNVEFGYGYEMVRDKILIVHDQDGTKVACTEIGSTSLFSTMNSPAPMKKYPAYEGIYVPTLEARTKYTNEAMTIMYNLTGVPCECARIGTAPNSCGLHIHEGTSCTTGSLVGGHWFNNRSADPWAYAPYTTRKCSEVCTNDTKGSTASGSLTVMYGNDYASTIHRVLVVHDYMGNRIGCAPLMGVPQINPTNSSPFPLIPVLAGGGGFVLLMLLAVIYCRRRKTNRARVGTLNEKLAPTGASAKRDGQNPTRRTLSVNHM